MKTLHSHGHLKSKEKPASPPSARLDSPSTSEQRHSSQLPDGACPDRQWPQCLLSLALILQTLGSAVLALAHSLVMLTVSNKCRHSSGVCAFLLLQDPSLSSLAVIMLTAVAMLQVRLNIIIKHLRCFDGSGFVTPPPAASLQVRRYGLLLLQATPPSICMSDLGQRIRSVPGVQAVHDLHIWQLSETVMVASVHVHCQAEFAANR